MAKLTIVFGALIALVGAVGYVTTHFWHAFISVGLGVVLMLLGVGANTAEAKRRMLLMHIAVTVGLLGFLGTIPGLIGVIKMLAGASILRPAAAEVQSATCVLCLVFALMCVRSFVAARRARA